MDRRDALFGTGLLALSALATMERASAQESAPAQTSHMHHGGHYSALADAAGGCVSTGQVCVSHCIGLLGKGNKDLAACATSVSQMLSLCSALQQLASQNAHYLPALAKVTLDACNDCEAECKKHADRHEPCNACMESCRACANECRAVLAT
ncbi:four-helix bundle copper-binding protein [Burkholderia ubonensis]|uniref:four-helix bundle copper-binding protein n=1 Tax=Burkholderia ubonensis TaxID=101571 RepID=UPI0009B4C52F|nr:four-helix bundle copper-binding protein [Burkholderia ubonensis]